jgi:cytochrome c553
MKKLIVLIVLGLGFVVSQSLAADAKENWKSHCAKCHGEDGKGQTKMGKKAGCKDYTDAKVQADMTDDKAMKAIKDGMKEGDKEVMKSYADVLSADEIKALIAHIRSFKK